MKYQCKDCGLIFDAEDARHDVCYTMKGEQVEDVDTCPKCYSEDLNDDYIQEPEREFTAEDKAEARGEWMRDLYEDR